VLFVLNKMPSPLHPTPRPLPSLPSRGVSAILAAGMLAAGIALGALIGPTPASSLASSGRAATVARVLALLALGDGTAADSQLAPPSSAGHASTSSTRQTGAAGAGANGVATSGASAAGGGHRAASAGASETNSTSSSSSGSSPSSGSASPTKGASSPNGSSTPKPARLAPVAHVWLIVLPYGASFANLTDQPSSAPYTTGQLVHRGTLLSSFSSLAASQLAGAAALLSGQVAAAVSTIVAPCPGAQGAAGTGTAGTGTAGAGAQGTGATSTQGTSTAGAASGATGAGATPCATSEPAGAQAADGFLREVVPRIEASAGYREGGLIAITFAATGEGAGAAGSSSATAPAAAPSSPPAIAYPAGTQIGTSTATGAPGALLLSPFLAHPGAHVQSAFDQLAPRASIEELLRDPSKR
jgi:hypothetical protein